MVLGRVQLILRYMLQVTKGLGMFILGIMSKSLMERNKCLILGFQITTFVKLFPNHLVWPLHFRIATKEYINLYRRHTKMNRFFSSIITMCLVCYSCTSFGSEIAVAKYKFMSGDYSSIETIATSAQENDSHSQYLLGQAYFFGKGVRRDFQLAAEWYLKSASNGNNEAMYVCATNYLTGTFGFERSEYKAIKLLISAANSNHLDSICALSQLDLEGVDSRFWKRKAVDLKVCK